MSAGIILLFIAVVIVLIAVAGTAFSIRARRRRLRVRFGAEYDRLVAERGSRREAEVELSSRERRVAGFALRPLGDQAYDDYSAQWARVREEFAQAPAQAITDAQALVEAVMRERGYPTADYQRELEDLSVEHASMLAYLRSAHATSERAAAGEASDEELGEAMSSYGELFEQLLAYDPAPDNTTSAAATETGADDGIPDEDIADEESASQT